MPSSYETSNERPIGRFFKSLEDQLDVHNSEAMVYARDFIQQNGHLLHKRKASFLARAELGTGNTISLPTESPSVDNGLWLELEVGNKSFEKEQCTWRISGGRDQYNLEVGEDGWLCTYIEKDALNNILRRYTVGDETASKVQLLIEAITDCHDFKVFVGNLEEKENCERAELKLLEESIAGSDIRTRKRIEALRSSLFSAGFSAGSVDRSHIMPLLNTVAPSSIDKPQPFLNKIEQLSIQGLMGISKKTMLAKVL